MENQDVEVEKTEIPETEVPEKTEKPEKHEEEEQEEDVNEKTGLKSTPKKGVGFAVDDDEPSAEKKIGAIEIAIDDSPKKAKKSPGNRTTTLAKMRKTLADGAKETADVISDASSFSLATKVESILWAIQESKEFHNDWGVPENMTLSEAFMLFWRGADGSIDGRKNSASLQALAYGAMLADLMHLDKITAQKMNKKVGLIKYIKYVLKPTSDLELDSFLDEALIYIIDQHADGKKKTVAKYVEEVATSFSEGVLMIDAIMESLVEKNIVGENTSKWLGQTTKKYPLGEKSDVYEDLCKQLRAILMDDGVEANPFFTFLVRFMRQADKEYFMRNPFMNHVLKNKMEWTKAKNKHGGSLSQFDKLTGEV